MYINETRTSFVKLYLVKIKRGRSSVGGRSAAIVERGVISPTRTKTNQPTVKGIERDQPN